MTGVLPVALGNATKALAYLLTAGKEYVALMHIHKPVSEADIRSLFSDFTGTISQLPPVRSSVKRVLRKRTIYYLEVLEAYDQDVLFRVGCQAGTYIRKLCVDMGKKLGVGAHMAELRRTRAGPFNEDSLVTLHDLKDAVHYWMHDGDETAIKRIIMNVETAVAHLPRIQVLDSAVDSLCHGASLSMPGISRLESGIKKGDAVAVMSLKGELVFVGNAQLSSEEMLADHGLAVKTERVFMQPGTYPKMPKL